jgi:hypothetical protein
MSMLVRLLMDAASAGEPGRSCFGFSSGRHFGVFLTKRIGGVYKMSPALSKDNTGNHKNDTGFSLFELKMIDARSTEDIGDGISAIRMKENFKSFYHGVEKFYFAKNISR